MPCSAWTNRPWRCAARHCTRRCAAARSMMPKRPSCANCWPRACGRSPRRTERSCRPDAALRKACRACVWDHAATHAALPAGTPMDLLERLVTIFAENGYVAVWIALMICGLGLPLPEDVTLVAGGVIAGLGYANVHAMFALCMVGVLLGDATVFLLGRRYGEAMLKWRWIARVLPPERFEV